MQTAVTTTRRFAWYALVAAVLAVVLPTSAVIAADLLLHQTRYAVNIWGYRGPVAGPKQPHEWRLAVLGESTAFGYGVSWNEAFPAYLQSHLNRDAPANRRATVVNLAYNNEGAHSYKFTLQDYAYLDYDAVLFYSGYNDLGGANTSVFRHDSAVFRLTGYMPLLPVVFHEKAAAIKNRWAPGATEGAAKTEFDPHISERATVAALEKALQISRSLEAQLGQPPREERVDGNTRDGAPCGWRWAHYCGGMYQAVKLALDRGKRVLVVTQPYYNAEHEEQQRRLHAFLLDRFGGNPRLRLANLGDVVDLRDPALCYDGLHLTPAGNQRVAEALVPHVRDLIP